MLICEFANVEVRGVRTQKAKIMARKNPANPLYARRAITTKGAVIETGNRDTVVTSRPDQEKIVNSIVIWRDFKISGVAPKSYHLQDGGVIPYIKATIIASINMNTMKAIRIPNKTFVTVFIFF